MSSRITHTHTHTHLRARTVTRIHWVNILSFIADDFDVQRRQVTGPRSQPEEGRARIYALNHCFSSSSKSQE
jgi:hypothetical protein